MTTLVTPITPAAILGHVDARPVLSPLLLCGAEMWEIGRTWADKYGLDKYTKIGRLTLQLEKLSEVSWIMTEVKSMLSTDRDAAYAVDTAMVNLSCQLKMELAKLLESDGCRVSVSAYDADSDSAVLYGRDGQPLKTLY